VVDYINNCDNKHKLLSLNFNGIKIISPQWEGVLKEIGEKYPDRNVFITTSNYLEFKAINPPGLEDITLEYEDHIEYAKNLKTIYGSVSEKLNEIPLEALFKTTLFIKINVLIKLFKEFNFETFTELFLKIIDFYPIYIIKSLYSWDVETDPLYNDKKIFVGIASIERRKDSLKKTINSILHQTDNLGVYLNEWSHIPEWLNHHKIKIETSQSIINQGDAGKFYWVDNHKGYYFSCDDDLIYPEDYIEKTIKKIENYQRKAAISYHGSIINENFTNYYDHKSRKVLSYYYSRKNDTEAHILGTGVLGFHSETINVRFEDFEKPNMADIYFALLAQQQKTPLIVQSHNKGEVFSSDYSESISFSGLKKDGSYLDTSELQNKIIKTIRWKINKVAKNNKKLLLIGRFSTYKKGGIYKTCHLMKHYLRELGYQVSTIDSLDENYTIPDNVDLCIVYPGDMSRPDFLGAEKKMKEVVNKGTKSVINLSYNNEQSRTKSIRQKMTEYSKLKSKVYLLSFSDEVKKDPILEKFKKQIVTFPKTLDFGYKNKINYGFNQRNGILLGDIKKLENEKIINGKAQDWIDSIKYKLPDVDIFCFKQYGKSTNLKNLTLVDYMKEGFSKWVSGIKISVCLNQKTTFEMLPTETQYFGIPVVYRDMPQSLNQWIGHTGILVDTPEEASNVIYQLYTDKQYWEEYSNLSYLNSKRNSIETIKIALRTSIEKLINS
jgi:hypothetical protein